MGIRDENELVNETLRHIAHQWRQPLSQINSNVCLIDDILYKLNVKDVRLEERLLEIEELTKYMSKTIDDFKNNDRENQEFYIKDILDEVYQVALLNNKNDDLYLDFDVKVNFRCNGNDRKMFQVLMVIVNNAMDALSERNINNPKIHILSKQDNEYYIVEVVDNGGGMTKKMIEKIFNQDYTTKHNSEGSGIGLDMAKNIILEMFNGNIYVENFNEGSCFRIKIPIS